MKAQSDIHAQIRKFRRIYKLKPGERSTTPELLEDRAEDQRSKKWAHAKRKFATR